MKDTLETTTLRAVAADRIPLAHEPAPRRPLVVRVGAVALAAIAVAIVPATMIYGAEAAVVLGFAAFFPLCMVVNRPVRGGFDLDEIRRERDRHNIGAELGGSVNLGYGHADPRATGFSLDDHR